MRIRSSRKGSLVSTVVERLREFVEQEKLKSGDRLPTEAELLEQLGVSRTVLREAIGRLETIGLVAVRHGQGMFVGVWDLASRSSSTQVQLDFSPTELRAFGGRDVWLLNSDSSGVGPFYVATGGSEPAAWFVPAGREQ